jgi:multidrug efflux pump subunit AcrB
MEMNPVIFAMRHPITTLILGIALIGRGGLVATRMRVDIFPSLNSTKIYVFLQYRGMSPSQMENLIVYQFELLFQYLDDVKSRSRETTVESYGDIQKEMCGNSDNFLATRANLRTIEQERRPI